MRTIAYIHIPKAAGTTLYTAMSRKFKKDEFFLVKDHETYRELLALPKGKLEKLKFISGHFNYGLHEILSIDLDYFTILRDPVERVISNYFYIKERKEHRFHQLIHNNNMSLQQFIEEAGNLQFNNGMVRMFATSGYFIESGIPYGEVNETHFTTAMKNIRKMSVKGLVENFEASTIMVRDAFGFDSINYTRENKTRNKKKHNIDEATIDLIRTYNKYDIQLYDRIRSEFEGIIKARRSYFNDEIGKMKNENKLYGSTWKKFHILKNKIGKILP